MPTRTSRGSRRTTRSTTRRATRPARRSLGRLVVSIGRFGSTPTEVRLSGRFSTVGAVLTAANIRVAGRQRFWLNGEAATANSRVTNGDLISIVTPKQMGR
jgi:hypothetical protein